ncbi:polysaccharide pyruvyl transferase family protein [Eubacterium sp. MSJ-33]|uniref:polysaccharide pyruvyl transferase family protein n=1 Tax=Eubacterium sp. MSJ-33 TaxID=2841528 RepID=UPI001C78CF33|nr:polysaccharide pyruvyl transferase family protein [Eubacterium sp. MSJ-33]QWT54151.1 polysaccharide pyruvyl transferase family protein [Eubacterium sp. MSJ-33]
MKKIGIVTTPRELNYGAVLQAYALQRKICGYGYDARLIWWSNQKELRRDVRLLKVLGMLRKIIRYPSLLRKTLNTYGHTFSKEFSAESVLKFNEFEKKYLNIDYKNYHQIFRFAHSRECKVVVAGSDQIWNSYAIYVDPFYYLRFAPKSKRIAYAPSLGKNDIPKYNKKCMKKYIQDFSKVSVREKQGQSILADLIGTEVPVVLDPSFLLDLSEWEKIETYIETVPKYILMYFLDCPNDMSIRFLKDIIKKYELPIIALPYKFEIYKDFSNLKFIDAGPREFLYLIHHAELILTDSFHGTAFSINYEKNFWVFDRQHGQNQTQVSRIIDLLNKFKLSNRFVTQNEDINVENNEIDYTQVEKILDKERLFSINYINEFLA